jgi:hypothetical protein
MPERMSNEEHIASRNSSHMRNTMGFFPTTKNAQAEWDFFVNLNVRVNDYLKKQRISGKNARESYDSMYEGVQNIVDDLYDVNVLPELLPTRGSCVSLVYSSLLSTMGSYDAYLTRQSKEKK